MDNNTFKINDNSSTFQNNSPSFFQWVTSISIYTWILFLIVLSLLTFNIFIYLDKRNTYLKDSYKYIYNIIKQTLSVSKEQKEENEETCESQKHEEDAHIKEKDISKIDEDDDGDDAHKNMMKNNPLNIALNDYPDHGNPKQDHGNDGDYQADDSRSFLNSRKEGWCFIGENNGARICGEVGINDKCMSGEIFPSREICVNPNIRV